jgi:hypothetical protein
MPKLRVIPSIDDLWCALIKDDPVRPEIAIHDRIGRFAEILVTTDEQDEPTAVLCIRYCGHVPSSVEELLEDPGADLVAVFYTIWSYSPGAGGRMISIARKHIERTRLGVARFVTLSPPTEMARRFHTKNGAGILRENASTVNYEYA